MAHEITFLTTCFTEYCRNSPVLQDEIEFLVGRIEQLESIDGRLIDSISSVGIFGNSEVAEKITIMYSSRGVRYEKDYLREELVPSSSLH